MVKTRIAVCAAIAVAVMLVLGSVPAKGAQKPANIFIIINENPSWEIRVADPRGPDICRPGQNHEICQGQRMFRWNVNGRKLAADERVVIKAIANVSPDCFGDPSTLDEFIIEGPTEFRADSGTPTCVGDKHGILWPYDITFEKKDSNTNTWNLIVAADPRGIVH